ncbi:DUF1203 domain-containing protein [Actibacterium sp. D379-3]
MSVSYHPLPTESVRALQRGARDAYGLPPERGVSDGAGTPCRHCLCDVPAGRDMLILAYRPFPALQPYAENGPIFLCADACAAHDPASGRPQILQTSPDYLIKGYCGADRIVYGTGQIVPAGALDPACAAVFQDPRVAYIHVRSARNNCYQARVERAG